MALGICLGYFVSDPIDSPVCRIAITGHDHSPRPLFARSLICWWVGFTDRSNATSTESQEALIVTASFKSAGRVSSVHL